MSEIINPNEAEVTLHPSGVRLWRGKRYVMITLVSRQTIPNIVPIFQVGAPTFDVIYVLHTEQYDDEFKWTKRVIEERLPSKVEWYHTEVDNGDYEVTRRVAGEIIEQVEAEADAGGYVPIVVCNWTLGTKPMAVGLVDAARNYSCPIIYVDTEKERILDSENIYPGPVRDKRFSLELTVEQYMLSHGLEIFKQGNPNEEWIKAAYSIVDFISSKGGNSSNLDLLDNPKTNNFFQAVRVNKELLDRKGLNSIQKKANQEQAKILTIDSNLEVAVAFADMLRSYNLVAASTLRDSAAIIELVSTDALRYLHGSWLEYYVYGKLYDSLVQTGAKDATNRVVQSANINWQKAVVESVKNKLVTNELDVLFTKGVEMAFISCKTGNYYRQGDKSEAVYQLDSIANSGGIFSKKVLIISLSSNEVGTAFKERAKVLKFDTFYLEDLPDIAEKINRIFEKGNRLER